MTDPASQPDDLAHEPRPSSVSIADAAAFLERSRRHVHHLLDAGVLEFVTTSLPGAKRTHRRPTVRSLRYLLSQKYEKRPKPPTRRT